MALKSVVVDPFFERLAAAFRTLQNDKGDLALILLSTSHQSVSKWDVTIAADWIDRMSPLKAASEISQALKQVLGQTEGRLGLVKVRSTSDMLVKSLTSTVDIPEIGAAYRVTGLDLDLFSIDEAVCLLSRPAARRVAPERISA